jgi:hypothetical protein
LGCLSKFNNIMHRKGAQDKHSNIAGRYPAIFRHVVVWRESALFTNADQYIVANTPLRPRIIGVRFGYSF